jgi:4-amino-4-deoxy-L-arabinose transferase-like glycosyltransferase
MNETAARPVLSRLVALLVLCFLVRAGLGVWWAAEKPAQFIGGDGAEYLDTAHQIATGHGYAIGFPRLWDWENYQPDGRAAYPKPETFRPPLYSIVLAVVVGPFGNTLWPIALLNAALSTVAAWFLFELARRAATERVAIIALLLYSLYPLNVVLGSRIGAEPLFGAVLGGAVWCLWRAREDRPILFAIAAGFFLGLATLTRSNAIFLWPLGCVWLFFCARGNRLTILWFTLLLFVVLLPWAARNRIVTGQWIFLSGSGGYNFWLGNNETAYRMFTARTSTEYDRWGRELLNEVVPAKVRAIGTNDMAIAQQFWFGEAKRFIREHPGHWLRLVGAKCVEFWRPYVRPGFFPYSYVVLSLLTNLPLFVLGWWGMALLLRKQPVLAWLLIAVLLAGMSGLVLSHVHVRLRVPFVDTFFAIPAAVVLAGYWERRQRSPITNAPSASKSDDGSGTGMRKPPPSSP